MKKNKNSMKTSLVIFSVTVFLCLLFKVFAFSMPSAVVKKNVEKSQITIESTGDYPILSMLNASYEWTDKGWNISDFYTEWMMLNVAYNANSNHPLKAAMLNTRIMSDTSNASASLLHSMNSEKISGTIDQPIQYWLGSAAIMRLLLCFYDYSQILTLLQVIFWLLFSLSCIYLYRRVNDLKTVIAYVLSLMSVLLPVTSLSFTYGMVFCVVFISIILISKYCYDLSSISNFFLVIGIITAYVDWMSTPSITCTLPLTICILITYNSSADNEQLFNELKRLWNIVKCGINWCIGYAGMLISKWIFSMLFTDEDIIGIVQERVMSDTGVEIENKIQYYLETLGNYSKMLLTYKLRFNWIWYVMITIILIGVIWDLYLKTFFSLYIELLIIAIVPFIWPIVLMWHSHEHYWFTYRNLVVTVFIVFELAFTTIVRKSKNKQQCFKV